jgi:hypothetical protein
MVDKAQAKEVIEINLFDMVLLLSFKADLMAISGNATFADGDSACYPDAVKRKARRAAFFDAGILMFLLG